jgi:hypothetical protein
MKMTTSTTYRNSFLLVTAYNNLLTAARLSDIDLTGFSSISLIYEDGDAEMDDDGKILKPKDIFEKAKTLLVEIKKSEKQMSQVFIEEKLDYDATILLLVIEAKKYVNKTGVYTLG